MTDDQLDELLRRSARSRSALTPDHARMLWSATSERRSHRTQRRRRVRIGLAAAACLVVGFGIGRWSQPASPDAGTAGASVGPGAGDRPELVQLVREGLPLLRDVERDPAGARLAGVEEMLWLTRRLRDAPPGDDPATALLLSDLELVLVQLLDAGRDNGETERTLAGDAVIARAIVPRMQMLDASMAAP